MLCFGDSATCREIRLKKIDKYVELKHVNHCIAALTFDKDRTEDFFEYFTKYCSLLENIKYEDHLDLPPIIS